MKTFHLLACLLTTTITLTPCVSGTVALSNSECDSGGFYAGSSGACLQWNTSSVNFYFTNSAQSVHADLVADVRAAAEEWNKWISSPQIVISNTYVNAEAATDGINVIHFKSSGWGANESMVQARTSLLASSHYIQQADVTINTQNFTFSKCPQAFKVDMKSLMIHEFGHVIGMTHDSEHFRSVMSPTLAYNFNRRGLFEIDGNHLGNVYPLKGGHPTALDPDIFFGWGNTTYNCD